MNKKRGEADVPKIVVSIIGGIALILMSSFIYLSLNGPDYTNRYLEKIEEDLIKNPIKKFLISFFEGKEEIPEGAEVIQVQTEEGEKTIIIEADLGELNITDIEKEIVNYCAVILKLYNLHEIPFTGITPKIQVYLGENSYYVEIIKGDIFVKEEEINNPDIIIRTTYEEALKMMEDNSYVKESFSSGKTSIEQVASNTVLFSKGYLDLYNEFT